MPQTNGVKTTSFVNANVVIATNIVPATVGLAAAIGAGARMKLRAWIPFTIGATGGIRLLPVAPAGAVVTVASIVLYNTVAPAATSAAQTAFAAFTNALANAGTHWAEVQLDVINGATAGSVDIQVAQNTSDALALTVLRGGMADITVY